MNALAAEIIDEERLEKEAFAALLLKTPSDPFKAALTLFPHNTNRALWCAVHWPRDAEVLDITKHLMVDDGEMAFLPSKAELARAVWDRSMGLCDDADFTKLAKLYGDIRGFIAKPDTNVNVQVNNNKVMIIKDLGSDADWEEKAADQQRKLLNVSTSRH